MWYNSTSITAVLIQCNNYLIRAGIIIIVIIYYVPIAVQAKHDVNDNDY